MQFVVAVNVSRSMLLFDREGNVHDEHEQNNELSSESVGMVAAAQLTRASTDFEARLGRGESLKPLEFLRLLESQTESGDLIPEEIRVSWGDSCGSATES